MVDKGIDRKIYRVLESLMLELPMEDKELWEKLERRTGCKVESLDAIPYWKFASVPDVIYISYADMLKINLTCNETPTFAIILNFAHVYSYYKGKGWIIYYRV
jgi:hypothetical protein